VTAREIVIDPVTRVEGHGKITIQLDEKGKVSNARFHVTQFRGFEKFCEGRLFWEMPSIMPRICGICSISHGLASAKACDAILGVEIPDTARKLRELLQAGELIQSHALHFFYLASPDLLLGMDADPRERNVLRIIDEHPDLARMGIGLRRFGQTIFERLSGARIHIDYPIAGGVSGSLSGKDRDYLLAQTKQQLKAGVTGLDLAKDYIEKGGQEVESFSKFRSMYMGLVNEEGNLEVYDGSLRLKSADGKVLEEVPSEKYASIINEGVEGWSYLKFPYYSKEAFPDGMYRVGPLGRLNVCDGIDTPLAREAAKEFKRAGGNRPVHSTMFYHWARMIELVHFMEKAQRILEDQSICGTDIVRSSQPRNTEGIGVTEAPRGTLIHHYRTNERGVITRVNLIVATGHNNLAMNRSVVEVARRYVDGGQIPEATLNRFEAAIRCYDPCLSCSTHAVGQMPLTVEVLSAKGELVQTLSR